VRKASGSLSKSGTFQKIKSPANSVHSSSTFARKFKAKPITPSRAKAAGQKASFAWTLTVDTPGGHAPKIAIVRGVETFEKEEHAVAEMEMETKSRSQPAPCRNNDSRHVPVPDKPVVLPTNGMLGSFQESGHGDSMLLDDHVEALAEGETTTLVGQRDAEESGDDTAFLEEQEADDQVDDESLGYVPNYFGRPAPSQRGGLLLERQPSDLASAGDSAAQYLEDLSLQNSQMIDHSESRMDDTLDSTHENDILTIMSSTETSSGQQSNPSLPPRQPTRQSSVRRISALSPATKRTKLRIGAGRTTSFLSRQSNHSTWTEGDDTLEDSQVLPLSNLEDQSWGEDGEDNLEGGDSESEDDSDDGSYFLDGEVSDDEDSDYIRDYVEEMQMSRVFPGEEDVESISDYNSNAGESIQEYYNRDRVTNMIMAIRKKEERAAQGQYSHDDDDGRHGCTPKQSNLRKTASSHSHTRMYEGFTVDLDNDELSANDETLTFVEPSSSGNDESFSNSTLSHSSIPSLLSRESQYTYSTRDAASIYSNANQSLPSIDEQRQWSSAPAQIQPVVSTNQQKWLAAVKSALREHRHYDSAMVTDGRSRIPKRATSTEVLNPPETSSMKETRAPISPRGHVSSSKKVLPRNHKYADPLPPALDHEKPPSVATSRTTLRRPSKVVPLRRPSGVQHIQSLQPTVPLRRPSNMVPEFANDQTFAREFALQPMEGVFETPDSPTKSMISSSWNDTVWQSPSYNGEMPRLSDHSGTNREFAQLQLLLATKGVQLVTNHQVNEMPALDDIREAEIIAKIARAKFKKEKKKNQRNGFFGGGNHQNIEEPSLDGKKGNFFDRLWSFGNASFSDMAEPLTSDRSTLVEPSFR
jgi:hypothetical protein